MTRPDSDNTPPAYPPDEEPPAPIHSPAELAWLADRDEDRCYRDRRVEAT